jgi:hypothetical protein
MTRGCEDLPLVASNRQAPNPRIEACLRRGLRIVPPNLEFAIDDLQLVYDRG